MQSISSNFFSHFRYENDPETGIARRPLTTRFLLVRVILPISFLILAIFVPVLGYPIGKRPGPEDEGYQYLSFIDFDIKGLVKEIPIVTIGSNYYLNCVATVLLLMKVMELLCKIGRIVLCCFPCCRKNRTSGRFAGALERDLERPVPGWQGVWANFGKLVGCVVPPITWDFTPEQVSDPEEITRRLKEGCLSYEDPNVRVFALCWGLASAYRVSLDHPQKAKAETETETAPPETNDASTGSTEMGAQTQLKVSTVSTKSTECGTQTQLKASMASASPNETETHTATSTVKTMTETETQTTNAEITIAPVVKKKT